MLENKFELNL